MEETIRQEQNILQQFSNENKKQVLEIAKSWFYFSKIKTKFNKNIKYLFNDVLEIDDSISNLILEFSLMQKLVSSIYISNTESLNNMIINFIDKQF
jgi:hypothetical protein